MDVGTSTAIVSMAISIMALVAAIAQVNLQASVEARRKGKTDKLAIGEWAMTWPQARLLAFDCLSLLHLPSPFSDPRVLTVPFISSGALEDFLRIEAQGEGRGPIERRMKARLVESATCTIATGNGHFTGRMYAVRGTTRKRSEACWSDAMDMCAITRKYWPLMTGASALACNGKIRPASAVTNLHSLWGFARAMGLRQIQRDGTRITMTNEGASIFLDQFASVDRPTRFAHFSGSPNARYRILEEMSQQTSESVYADACWSTGHVPPPSRLEPGYHIDKTRDLKTRDLGTKSIVWPTVIDPPDLDRNDPFSEAKFSSWATHAVAKFGDNHGCSSPQKFTLAGLIDVNEIGLISCIKTYPKSELSAEQLNACHRALLWCIQHWWLDPYQIHHQQHNPSDIPQVPLPDILHISSEFVTGQTQANLWRNYSKMRESVLIDPDCWSNCLDYASRMCSSSEAVKPRLQSHDQVVLVKVLQGWKLQLFCKYLLQSNSQAGAALTCQIGILIMALLGIAMDSSTMGSSESNKALEIELG